jgi:hypothetical protein
MVGQGDGGCRTRGSIGPVAGTDNSCQRAARGTVSAGGRMRMTARQIKGEGDNAHLQPARHALRLELGELHGPAVAVGTHLHMRAGTHRQTWSWAKTYRRSLRKGELAGDATTATDRSHARSRTTGNTSCPCSPVKTIPWSTSFTWQRTVPSSQSRLNRTTSPCNHENTHTQAITDEHRHTYTNPKDRRAKRLRAPTQAQVHQACQ